MQTRQLIGLTFQDQMLTFGVPDQSYETRFVVFTESRSRQEAKKITIELIKEGYGTVESYKVSKTAVSDQIRDELVKFTNAGGANMRCKIMEGECWLQNDTMLSRLGTEDVLYRFNNTELW